MQSMRSGPDARLQRKVPRRVHRVRGILGQVGQRRHQVHSVGVIDEQPVFFGWVRLQAERLLVKALGLGILVQRTPTWLSASSWNGILEKVAIM